MTEITERYGTRWVADAAGVTQNMIRKVCRGESKLSQPKATRLSLALRQKKGDDSLVVLMTGETEVDEPWVNGSLDDEVLDMDAATVEARRAFANNDRAEAVRRLVSVRNIERRMAAEIRRMR